MTRTSAWKRDDEAVQSYIERTASVLVDAGWTRMPARVYVALMTTDSGRLTAAEIAEILRISPAAVSGAVRFLLQVQMIRRERRPGSRRDVFVMDDDPWGDAVSGRNRVLINMESALREGVEVVGAGTPAGERMFESLELVAFMRQELDLMMDRWRVQRDKLREQRDDLARRRAGHDTADQA